MNPKNALERTLFVQYYYHRTLTDLDDNGFGVKLEKKNSAYTPPHWHQAVELLLLVKGKITCKFSSATIRFQPGELYIINSYDVHETHCSRDAEYLCVHILPSAMCRYVADFDKMNFTLRFDAEDQEKAAAREALRQHMEQILQVTRENPKTALLESQSRLFAITAILVKHFSQPLAVAESKAMRSDMTRLEPVLDHVHLHHDEELTLEDAADSMGLNREYFCRLFKKNMGVSYLQFVYQVRAAAVCRELETCDDPIGIIADRHGFRDPKLLCRYFKELYGCTPSEKRKNLREMNQER